jgi:hypothetical protein
MADENPTPVSNSVSIDENECTSPDDTPVSPVWPVSPLSPVCKYDEFSFQLIMIFRFMQVLLDLLIIIQI